MKQLTQTQRQGRVMIEEVSLPALTKGGVLVGTAYSLISAGTERAKVELANKSLVGKARARPEQFRQVMDAVRQQGLRATYQKVKTRLETLEPLGYSASGVVLAVGAGVNEFRVGDRVACAGAGYATHSEINFVPKNLCAQVPEKVSLQEAAFATVGAIALQGVRQSEVRLGEVAVVIGLGLLGLLTVQLLKATGCLVLGMDTDPERCHLGRLQGCDQTSAKPEEMCTLTASLSPIGGADIVIITAATPSSEPIYLAGELCRDRGRVVVVGDVALTVPRNLYYPKELELRLSRSYGPGRYDPAYEEKGQDYPLGYVRWTEKRNLEAFLHFLSTGQVQVQPLITHQFHLEQATEAYDIILGKRDESYLGVLLSYGEPKELELTLQPSAPTTPEVDGTDRCHPQNPVIGFIGAGNFAQASLLPHLQGVSGLTLKGVATNSGLSARKVSRQFGFAIETTNAEDLFSDETINTIFVATRHDSHAHYVLRSLETGKNVFVEKPLCLDEQELEKISSTYASCAPRPLLMLGFNRRFAPLMVKVKKFFSRRVAPMVAHLRINAGFIPKDHWSHDPEIGGGRFIGEGCHFVDLLRFLVGSPVQEVFAKALPVQGQSPDSVCALLQFRDGSLAVLEYLANGNKNLPKEYYELHSEGRSAILEDFHTLMLSDLKGQKRFRQRQNKGHAQEVDAFIKAVKTSGTAPIPFEEVVEVTKATFAIMNSVRTDQKILM